jgi:hypothetical protein
VSGIEVRLDQPLFPDALGGFRDPANDRWV